MTPIGLKLLFFQNFSPDIFCCLKDILIAIVSILKAIFNRFTLIMGRANPFGLISCRKVNKLTVWYVLQQQLHKILFEVYIIFLQHIIVSKFRLFILSTMSEEFRKKPSTILMISMSATMRFISSNSCGMYASIFAFL